MKFKNVELEAIAVKEAQYPPGDMLEIAVVGRSNVGKSSFINTLLGRKDMAYISSKPGKTRTINFYNIDGLFRLVDLPGYGYAIASKKEKQAWANTIDEYLNGRENLVEVVALMDMRHPPSKQDVEMYQWILEQGFAGMIVATKADKLSQPKRKKALNEMVKTLKLEGNDAIFPYSSVTGENIEEIRETLLDMIQYHKEEA